MNNKATIKVGSIIDLNDNIGVSKLEEFIKYELGNYVVLKIHWQKQQTLTRPTIEKAINMCVECEIHFSLGEFLNRYTLEPQSHLTTLTSEDWSYFKELGGAYYVSNWSVCERGGAAYWPLKFKSGSLLMPKAENMKEAHDFYRAAVNKAITLERGYGREMLESIDSSLLQKYHIAAGVEYPSLEVMPGNSDLMFPAIRGAVHANGIGRFSTDIASLWYGGVEKDPLYLKRWQLSLYYSYLAGADCIYSETGEFGVNDIYGKTHSIDSEFCEEYRKILKDFHKFTENNPRPIGKSMAKIGIVHGQYDGTPGLWNKEVWGQYQDEKWLEGAPEESWQLINVLLRKNNWFDAERIADRDHSGNPPLGQFDIIPIESSLEVLKEYSSLVFLGWNTMDSEIYDKLVEYVKDGGHLLMSLGHLNIELDRAKELKMFNGGDLKELFGVSIKGGLSNIRHSGIKIVKDSCLPSYKFPNWTERVDPKWMDSVLPAASVESHGAESIAQISGAIADYQLEKWNEKEDDIPALTEYKLGKGVSQLVTLWGYPGSTGIKSFYEEILKVVNAGEQDDHIQVCASDRVRYSVYEESDKYVMFLLNTDFDLKNQVKVYHDGEVESIGIDPVEMLRIEIKKR